jgi:hypothetical protein
MTIETRVSFETSFDSKQPKLEPKLVSALSETKRLFRLFRFYTERASFGVSIEPKQTETKKQYEKYFNHLKCRPLPPLFPIHTRPVITNREISLYRVKRVFPAADKLYFFFFYYFLELRALLHV